MRVTGVPALLLCTVLAMAGPTRADEACEYLRGLVEGLQTEESRRDFDVDMSGAVGAKAHLTACEWLIRSGRTEYAYVLFSPSETEVRVVRVVLKRWPPEVSDEEESGGICTEQCALSLDQWRELQESVGRVALLRLRARPRESSARLAEAVAYPGVPPEVNLRIDGVFEGSVSLAAGVPCGRIVDSLGEAQRTALYYLLLRHHLEDREWSPAQVPEVAVSTLRDELLSTSAWRRELRTAMLGWLGGPKELQVLRSAMRVNDPGDEIAVLQLETTVSSADPRNELAVLLRLRLDARTAVRGWAKCTLKRRHAPAYKEELRRLYRASSDWETRRECLREFEACDPGDLSLHREALQDPVAENRIDGALKLSDGALLLEIARDKSLTAEHDFWGRLGAITYLTWGGEPELRLPEGVGEALLEIMNDSTEDDRVRNEAAQGLGQLGHRKAIPALLRALASPPSKLPVCLEAGAERDANLFAYECDLRVGAAYALGLLRAKESSEEMLAILREYVADEDDDVTHALALQAAKALARMGIAEAEPLLAEVVSAKASRGDLWERALLLLRAVRKGDGRAILDAGPGGNPRFITQLLAECVSPKNLSNLERELVATRSNWTDVVREAIKAQGG